MDATHYHQSNVMQNQRNRTPPEKKETITSPKEMEHHWTRNTHNFTKIYSEHCAKSTIYTPAQTTRPKAIRHANETIGISNVGRHAMHETASGLKIITTMTQNQIHTNQIWWTTCCSIRHQICKTIYLIKLMSHNDPHKNYHDRVTIASAGEQLDNYNKIWSSIVNIHRQCYACNIYIYIYIRCCIMSSP